MIVSSTWGQGLGQVFGGYRLVTLGEWRLENRGVEIPVRAKKARALISFLAYSPAQKFQRDSLAGMLWPGLSRAQALASLRQSLAEIKRATKDFPPLLEVGHSDIRIAERALDLDTDELLSSIEAMHLPDALRESLAALPRLLADFQTIGEEYETWVTNLRHNRTKRVIDALLGLCREASLDSKDQLEAAQSAYQLDGFDEAAARAVMESYATLDEIPKAIEFYDELCKNFELELDTEPSLKTQDLAAQIKLNLSFETTTTKVSARPEPKQPGPGSFSPLDSAIAVLPFHTLGPVALPSYVQFGLMDEITCTLAGTIAPSPVSSNSMRRFLDQPPPSPSEIGRETGARYVLSGFIRSNGDHAKVTVQMADTKSEQVVWAEVFRSSLADVLSLETPISQKIVSTFVPSLHGIELGRTRSFQAAELEPFHLILRARELMFKLSADTFSQAGALLESAIEKGPGFAPSYSALADWLSVRIWQGWSQDENADQKALEQHALTAINLNPTDGRTMALLGHNRLIFSYKYDEAQSYFDRAVDHMPSDAETLNWTVPGLTYAGNPKRAIENGERSLALSPFDPFRFRNQHFLSIAHYSAGNFDQAAALGLESYESNPSYVSNLRFTIASLFASGQKSKARDLVAYHHEIEPDFRVSGLMSRHPYRSRKKRDQYGAHLVEAGLVA